MKSEKDLLRFVPPRSKLACDNGKNLLYIASCHIIHNSKSRDKFRRPNEIRSSHNIQMKII